MEDAYLHPILLNIYVSEKQTKFLIIDLLCDKAEREIQTPIGIQKRRVYKITKRGSLPL